MTASNIWALVVASVVVGGTITGVVVYKQNHPETPLTLSSVLPDAMKPASKPTAPEETKAPAQTADRGPAPPSAPSPEEKAGEAAAAAAPDAPHFDIVRVEPTGEAVVAGQAKPNSTVDLMSSGQKVGEAKTDASGQFVITPEALKPGDHDLTLRQTSEGKPPEDSKQSVAVSVPKTDKGQVVVALAEPGKPTKVLAAPAGATTAAPKPPSEAVALAKPEAPEMPKPVESAAAVPVKLAIRSVDLENGNGLYATGTGPAGTSVRIYLNDAHIADVSPAPEGTWSVTVKKGLTGGHYRVRADALGPDGKKVVARVEVPFDVPVAMAEAAKPAGAPASAPDEAPSPPHAPIPDDVAGLGAPPSDARTAQPAEMKAAEAKAADAKGAEAKTAAAAKILETKAAEAKAADLKAAQAESARAKAAYAKAAEARAAEARAAEAKAADAKIAEAKAAEAKAAYAKAAEAKAAEAKAADATAAEARAAGARAADAKIAEAKAAEAKAADAKAAEAKAAEAKAADAKAAYAKAAEDRAAEAKVADARAAAARAAETKAAEAAASAAATSSPSSNVVVESIETANVVAGDNLWNISRIRLGDGMRYTQIYTANADQIRNPNLIYPGQVFVVPAK